MSNQLVITSGAKVRSLNGVITGTTGVLDSLPINAANGIPQLDSSGKILVSQLPNSVMEYKGTWNAATNTPTLADGTGNQGDVYLCNVAGTVNFGSGPIAFVVGDQVIYSGTIWQRASGATGTVTSVAVTESGDALSITGSPITTSGTINIGFAGTSAQYVAGDGSLITFPSTISQAQRLITEVYNNTGATLTKGTVVYINGGQGNLPTVTKAIATGDSTSAQTYGVVQSNITNMNNGYVVVIGSLSDLDTQAYAAGTQLYLSSTTAGAWTSVKQYAPAHLVYVGIVVRSHPTQGVVEVRIQNGFELDELHNVSAQTPSNNDGIFYNSSNSLWEAKSIDTALGYTPVPTTRTLTINGTTYDLSANRSWTINSMVYPGAGIAVSTGTAWGTSITDNSSNWNTAYSLRITSATSPLSITSNVLSISQASGSTNGYLSSTDWTTFNNKQNALTNPVTGTGTSGQVSYFNGTSTITGSNNFKFDGTNLSIGNPSSALAQLHIYNSAAAASFLLQTNSTTDYSEIAVRNDSSTATSYFRQYSTAATGSDFGISRAGLALFFSNYATNFAIGTRNGGNLIFGTADTERARIDTSGNMFIGTSTASSDYTTAKLTLASSTNYTYQEIRGSGTATLALTQGTTASTTYPSVEISNSYNFGIRYSSGAFSNYPMYYYAGNGAGTGDYLFFQTAGSERLRITSAGNVGIGLNSIDTNYKLIVRRSTNVNIGFGLQGGEASIESFNDALTSSMPLRIYGSSLSFFGAATFSSSVKTGAGLNVTGYTNSSSGNYWEIGSDASGYYMNALNRSSGNYNLPAYIDAQKLIINSGSGGNVGIGTSSPGSLLTLYATTTPTIAFQNSGAVRGYLSADSGNNIYNAVTGNGHVFQCDSTEKMRLTSSGNLGIGTSSPSQKLDVQGGIYASYLRQNGRPGDGGTTMYTGSTGGALGISNGTNTVTINRYAYSGFAGFLSSNSEFYGMCNDHEYGGPGAQLSIIAGTTTGTIAFFVGNPTSQPNGAYQAPKVSYINSSGTYVTVSDANKKKDLESSKIGLKEVLQLNPTLFRMKFEDETIPKQLGFIAQEVKEVIPEAYYEDGTFIGLTDRPIIAALVKAIQEQQAQIEELKSKIK